MANYTLTSASVQHSTSAEFKAYTAGATIAAGQPVYLDAAALDAQNKPKAKLADANASAATSAVHGIAANTASSGQPVRVVTYDPDFTHGLATTSAGEVIVLSATAGGLAPSADIASGWYPVVVGVATSATKCVLSIVKGTAAKA